MSDTVRVGDPRVMDDPLLAAVAVAEEIGLHGVLLRITGLPALAAVDVSAVDALDREAGKVHQVLVMSDEELEARRDESRTTKGEKLETVRERHRSHRARILGALRNVQDWNPPPAYRETREQMIRQLRGEATRIGNDLENLPTGPREESLAEFRLRVIGQAAHNVRVAAGAVEENAKAALTALRQLEELDASFDGERDEVWVWEHAAPAAEAAPAPEKGEDE